MARDLLVGQTQIGTSPRTIPSTGEIIEFEVYYGNVLLPLVDNEIKHLPDDEYLEILANFFSTEAGREYNVPTPKQVTEASQEMYERELAFKEKNKDRTADTGVTSGSESSGDTPNDKNMSSGTSATPANDSRGRKTDELKSYSPEDLALEGETANSSQVANKSKHQEESDVDADEEELKSEYKSRKKPTELNRHPNPSYERLYRALVKKQGKLSGLKIALITFILLFAVSAFGLYYVFTNFYNLLETKQAEIRVNGEAYTLPIDFNEITLENGESKFFVFGLSIQKDEEGNTHQVIVPFGQLNDTYASVDILDPEEETDEEEHTVIPEKVDHSSGQIKVSGD